MQTTKRKKKKIFLHKKCLNWNKIYSKKHRVNSYQMWMEKSYKNLQNIKFEKKIECQKDDKIFFAFYSTIWGICHSVPVDKIFEGLLRKCRSGELKSVSRKKKDSRYIGPRWDQRR